MRVGLIADTHGLLRPEAVSALVGVDVILHAGDVGDPVVLERLRDLAPVEAVRGNVDEPAAVRRSRRRNAPDPEWAAALPERLERELGGTRVLMLHALQDLSGAPPPGVRVVVAGHSHRPRVESRDGILYVNPGSAGPRRFRLPVTVGMLWVDPATAPRAEILELLG
ncbi:MAG TPA: metallophosphoesterase family protein [Polyangiaceae bacterium LLY-WYZ-14_1]|jgi:hypothetical protein|nr:metallophosphoesterase family protein [Polyangiaceae bacterium LLY-WYZ-14_1]